MYRVSIMLSTLARLGLVFVCPFHKMGRSICHSSETFRYSPFESYQLWSSWVQVIETKKKKKKGKLCSKVIRDKISLIGISTKDTICRNPPSFKPCSTSIRLAFSNGDYSSE